MTLGIGSRAYRHRVLRGYGTPMCLPQHDVCYVQGRPFGAGSHATNPIQCDISGKSKRSTASDQTLARPYRSANAHSATANGQTSDAWSQYINSSGTHYNEIDYDSQNAITSGDFHVRARIYVPSVLSGSSNYYIFGVQGSTPNGSDTAWVMLIGLASQRAFAIAVSDGATRSVYGSGTDDFPSSSVNYDMVLERYNGTLYGYVNGVRKLTQAYSSTLNIPSVTKLRLGRTTGGFGSAIAPLIFDFVQIKRRSLFLGAATAPSPMYPFPN